jgi:hypothetical protein
MDASSKPAAAAAKSKKWGSMSGLEKTTYVAKVCLMVCSFGFIYGGVLTE